MNTKEQLLDKNGFDFKSFKFECEYSAKSILSAMDEYADHQIIKQKEKIKELKREIRNLSIQLQDIKEHYGKS